MHHLPTNITKKQKLFTSIKMVISFKNVILHSYKVLTNIQ